MIEALEPHTLVIAIFLFASRGFALGGALVVTAFLFANGFYTLVAGKIFPEITGPRNPGKTLPYPSRLVAAVFYLAVATALALLLRKPRETAFAGLMLGGAILAIFHPVVIVRWAKGTHPDLSEDDDTNLWIARLVGVGLLGFAVFFLVLIDRSFLR